MTPRLIATCFGIGKLPGAPGSWAAVAAIPLAWGLHAAGGFWALGLATVALAVLGSWAMAREGATPQVVVDQLVGMLVAQWPLSIGLGLMGAEWYKWPWPGWGLGFVLFRFFAIVQPPPVGWAVRLAGPRWGMLGGIVAGALTALISTLAAGVAHGWF